MNSEPDNWLSLLLRHLAAREGISQVNAITGAELLAKWCHQQGEWEKIQRERAPDMIDDVTLQIKKC